MERTHSSSMEGRCSTEQAEQESYPEGFTVTARLWPEEGRTSSGIKGVF